MHAYCRVCVHTMKLFSVSMLALTVFSTAACSKPSAGKRAADSISAKVAKGDIDGAFVGCTGSTAHYSDAAYKAACAPVLAAVVKLTGDAARSAMVRCEKSESLMSSSPELAKACADLASADFTDKAARASKGRDDGTGDMGQCSALKHAALKLSAAARADAQAAAKALCSELLITSMVHRSLEEVRANIAANKAEIPDSCSGALNQLFRLETDWAKKSFDELFKLCDVDLGKLVLESERGGAKPYMCPDGILSIKKSLAGFKQTQKYPELTAEVAAVPGCT